MTNVQSIPPLVAVGALIGTGLALDLGYWCTAAACFVMFLMAGHIMTEIGKTNK